LFDGKDLSKWYHHGRGANRDAQVDGGWKVENGYFEITRGFGDLLTRDKFGDVQIHVEWSSPTTINANSQGRGNSGVLVMSRYEIQVLDMWDNPTYADGKRARSTASGRRWRCRRAGRASGTPTTSCSRRRNSTADKLVKPAFCHGLLQRRDGSQSQGKHGAYDLPAVVAHYTPHRQRIRSCCRTTTPTPAALSGTYGYGGLRLRPTGEIDGPAFLWTV